jgi:hypothetical protein
MRSARGIRFRSVLFPNLFRGAQTTRVSDLEEPTWFLSVWLVPEAWLYRFMKNSAAFVTAALERPQIGGA